MKAENYISFYGLLSHNPVYWEFTKKSQISIADFIENNPDYDLDEWELERVYRNETYSLSKYFSGFKDEKALIQIFRGMFDEYRSNGGEPLTWLYFTFNYVSGNPTHFPAEHLGMIEKNLIQWIENFEKQPFDSLADLINKNNIIDLISTAVVLTEPKRTEVFNNIIENLTNETTIKNIRLIKQRIDNAIFQPVGFTQIEIEYYQSFFVKDFYEVLHSDNYQIYIEDKIRELYFYCKGLEQELKTKQYEFLEDREQDKNQHTEAEQYKVYLENLLIHLNTPAPQQSETKTGKLNALVLGLFCSLIDKIGIDKKDETESATIYCKRICSKFKLPYTDRVRQNYNVKETKKLIQELTEKVLPLIDDKTINLIKKYLDNKQPPKQNLYA